MSSLEISGLEVRYGGLVAVRGIDVTVGEGEIVLVIGANGAGKSSTLNAVSGRIRGSAGSVHFAGRDITRWPAHRVAREGLVLVPEGRRVFAPLTVEQNLLLGGFNTQRRRRTELLDEVYAMFPILEERRNGPAGLLSGGEQQMLAFGRALMSEPKLMLLDESSMGLAPVIIASIMRAITEIARRGPSILMVEQNVAAFEVADRAYVLEQGEIVLDGPAADVADDPLVLRAFLGIEERIEQNT
jgi:branched-chain amino acid transport system ATP-binding protein